MSIASYLSTPRRLRLSAAQLALRGFGALYDHEQFRMLR